MEKRTAPIRHGRVRLVVECETSLAEPVEWVRLTCSLPGRGGTLSKVWMTEAARLPDPAWQDLSATVLSWLSQLLETLGGSQMSLDL